MPAICGICAAFTFVFQTVTHYRKLIRIESSVDREYLPYLPTEEELKRELEPQNPNPRGAHGDGEERDPLDEISAISTNVGFRAGARRPKSSVSSSSTSPTALRLIRIL
jgi:hypothetical protein